MFCRTVLFLMKMETALAKKTGDVFSKAKRSEVMSRIRSRGTRQAVFNLRFLLWKTTGQLRDLCVFVVKVWAL
jgi:hypothetical protein